VPTNLSLWHATEKRTTWISFDFQPAFTFQYGTVNEMNDIALLLFALCGAAFLWNLASGIRIANALEKTNTAKSVLVLRYMPWRYLQEYQKLIISQTGQTGPLYYHYTFSSLTILLLALILVSTLAMQR
jgi:hypothetical protein